MVWVRFIQGGNVRVKSLAPFPGIQKKWRGCFLYKVMAAVARQYILCCCKCVAWKNCLQEYSLLCCFCQFEAETFSVRNENYCLVRWCLPTLQQCVWQPLLASYLLFQCLGDCLMFKGRNITADCISCIVPPFFPPSPSPSPQLSSLRRAESNFGLSAAGTVLPVPSGVSM